MEATGRRIPSIRSSNQFEWEADECCGCMCVGAGEQGVGQDPQDRHHHRQQVPSLLPSYNHQNSEPLPSSLQHPVTKPCLCLTSVFILCRGAASRAKPRREEEDDIVDLVDDDDDDVDEAPRKPPPKPRAKPAPRAA